MCRCMKIKNTTIGIRTMTVRVLQVYSAVVNCPTAE